MGIYGMAKEVEIYGFTRNGPTFGIAKTGLWNHGTHFLFSSSRMFIDVGSSRWELTRREEAMVFGIPETMVFRKISI